MGAVTKRFGDIPRVYEGCVYAVEMSNGVVKVGSSRNPRTRMETLMYQVRSKYGCGVVRFFIGRDIPYRNATVVERKVICVLGRMGNPLPRTKEFFVNVRFGDAVNVIRQMNAKTA